MKKTWLTLVIAAVLGFGLSACGEQNDRDRDDPRDPMQQVEEADERDARQQEVRDERSQRGESLSAEMDDGNIDPARDSQRQPPGALSDSLGDTSDPQTVRTHTQEHTELQQELRQYLQQTNADSRDQCAAIPYGHKACGGPETYIVYSQRDMDENDIAELNEQVARYNQLDAFLKTSRGVASTCDITPEPEIRFENGRCIAASQPLRNQ